jgi:nucleoside-diphosphate-sugar epimerase
MSRMSSSFQSDGLIRLAADIAIVHCAMLAALGFSIVYMAGLGHDAGMSDLYKALRTYYLHDFIGLSLLFPAVFSFSGFYTRSRAYNSRYKVLVVARSVGIALLVFFFASYLVDREDLISRSTGLAFAAMVLLGVPGARVIKLAIEKWLSKEVPVKAPTAATDRPVLVVGGAGYIGSILVRALLSTGRRVRVLDNLVYGDAPIRDLLSDPNFELMVGDCRNIQSTVAAVKGVEAIVHLAAIVGDPACEQDRQTALEVNYAATRMLIEVAKGDGVARLVFTSSCSVYGATELLMDEQSPVEPISLYAETKVDSEDALLAARSDSFHPTILRLATVFGNSYRPRFDLVVNLLTAKAYQEGLITIYNGMQWRPFIHVTDVTRAVLAVLNAPIQVVSGQVYNVGDSRQNWTLGDIADKVRGILPNTRVAHVENSDRRNYRVSFEKIRRELGFECLTSIEDGIRELQRAFADGQITDYSDVQYNNQKLLSEIGERSRPCAMDSSIMAAFAFGTAETRAHAHSK